MSNSITLVNKQTGNLNIKYNEFKDNSSFDHIQHLAYYSLIWIKKGKGIARVGFSEYEFSSDTMFSFTPYQPFMFDSDEDIEGIVINFHPDFFCIFYHQEQVACNGVLFNDIYKPPFFLVDESSKIKFDARIEQIHSEMKNSTLAQDEMLVSHLKIFLIEASRLKLMQQTGKDDNSPSTAANVPPILQNLKNLIEIHYKTKHSAKDYAEILNITPKALGKITKTHFNRTLTDMISDRIIIEAKRELYLTNKSVKEIAYDLGYSDEHYFSRFFKNRVDVSPKMYRENVGYGRGEK